MTEAEIKAIEWEPAPGFVLCLPKKREDLQKSKSGLSLPDKAGKVADNVGIGEVVKLGPAERVVDGSEAKTVAEAKAAFDRQKLSLKVGDLVAFMPFTDSIIEINMKKYSLVPYDKIRAVLKKGEK